MELMMSAGARRHLPRILGPLLLVTAAACSSPAPTGGSGATSSAASAMSGASGGDVAARVMLGGRQVYLECHGSGRPTVVMQSGYGNAGDIWSVATAHLPAAAPGLAATNRVCVYDRPGSTLTIDAA